MKNLLPLFLLVFCLQTTKAQFVTIPDANFVLWLQSNVPGAMVGNQMNTTHPSVTSKTYIKLYNLNISDLTGIQYFTSLDTLECTYTQINTLPTLSNSITQLILANNPLTTLPSLPTSLLSFYCMGNTSLTTLPVLPPLLKELFCSNNQLNSLPNLPNSLKILDCKYNSLTVMPPLPNSMTELTCQHNQIGSLPALPNSIISMNCAENNLSTLPSLPNSLTDLYCKNNMLTNLPTLPNSLVNLNCSYNQLANLPSFPNSLINLFCSNNLLINLPTLPNSLNKLYCSYNQLNSLPQLPSGLDVLICSHNNISCFPFFPNIPSHYIQWLGPPILAFEISPNPFTCLPNYIGGMDTVTLNYPLCVTGNTITNPNGCISAEGITGIVFNDQNSDCIKNIGEGGVKNGMIKLYNNSNQFLGSTSINANGSYFFNDTIGTYKVILDTLNTPYAVQCINPGIDSLVTLTTSHTLEDSVNFAVICNPGFDVGIQSIHRNGAAFPGVSHYLIITAGDMGQWYNLACNNTIAGTVSFSINGPITYVGPSPGALVPSVVGNVYTYNITNFATINNSIDFRIIFTTNTTAQIGDMICVNATVTPIAGDNNISNNTYQYCYPVSNSCDPNIKDVYPVAVAPNFTDWLTYTIHFQNTGNAPAMNIRLEDNLDAKLDPETFQVINYSDYNIVDVIGNHLTVRFPNIQLTDSTSDPIGSIGFIQYRIKPKANWISDTIRNSAEIYFDYNSPIVTNTAKSYIMSMTEIKDLTETSFLNLYPNPTSNSIVISSQTNFNKVEVQSITGQVLFSETVNGKTHQLQLQNYADGVYFVKVRYADGRTIIKKLIKQ